MHEHAHADKQAGNLLNDAPTSSTALHEEFPEQLLSPINCSYTVWHATRFPNIPAATRVATLQLKYLLY